jgi:AraC-like DNA-binding protein
MDPLTQIFTEMRVKQATFTRLEATAPWGLASNGEQAVKFVLVVHGAAVLVAGNEPEPISLRTGDVFIMFGDEAYRLFDHAASRLMDCVEVEKLRIGHRIEIGGGGPAATFIAGAFELDGLDAQPLLSVLPKLLHLELDVRRSLAFQSVLEMLAAETDAPGIGSEAVVGRLFELLFVHAIRAFAAQGAAKTHGWLAALADRNLSHAIKAIHGDPARNWTVGNLAREAGMSRSSFANRFRSVVGRTPMEYLTHWRIYRAARMVQRRSAALSEVSRTVGYESMAAFNRAFKKEIGQTPGAYRKAIGLSKNVAESVQA